MSMGLGGTADTVISAHPLVLALVLSRLLCPGLECFAHRGGRTLLMACGVVQMGVLVLREWRKYDKRLRDRLRAGNTRQGQASRVRMWPARCAH